VKCGRSTGYAVAGGCDHCNECFAKGYRYCIKCGRSAGNTDAAGGCDRCNECTVVGYRYCIKCGRPTGNGEMRIEPAVRESGFVKAAKTFGLIVFILSVPYIFFEIFTMFWVMGDVLPNVSYGVPLIYLTPSPEAIVMYGFVAEIYYLFLVAAVLVSFLFILYESRDGIKEALGSKYKKLHDSPLFAVTALFAATVAFNVILNIFLSASGNEPGLPDFGDPWKEQFLLLNASVWEEVLCRVLMIGLPLMIAGFLKSDKTPWKRLFGRFEMNNTAVFFIIVSAAIFSYAHLDGWDAFKLAPTFVTGLALGYLFVKYGVHASIMLHFLIDYLTAPSWVLGNDLGDELANLFLFAVIFMGALLFVWYLQRSIRFVKERMS
jgi:hypothetical protein